MTNATTGYAPSVRTRSAKIAITILLVLAAGLRVWNLPAMNEVRDWDEVGYATDGLVAWEGLLPGWESTPAGPQAWESWLFAAGRTGWEYVKLRNSGMPPQLKPLVAIDRALFKTYEDMGPLRLLLIWISIAVALFGVYGAYRLGVKYGGLSGGFLLGGLAAVLPLYIENAGISKTCSDAWMFAILAISCAATMNGPKRCWWAGIMFGLAVGSRADMILVTPLVMWALWDGHEKGSLWKNIVGTMALTIAVMLLSAPFAMPGFLGILRNTALAGGSTYWGAEPQRLLSLKEWGWGQGLAPIIIAAVIGCFFIPAGTKLKRGSLAVFALLALASVFVRHHQPIRYNGSQLLVVLMLVAVGIGALFQRWPKPGISLAVLLLLFPLVQAVRGVIAMKARYVPENATEWVDAHIPAGTTVYLHPLFTSRAVLPTEASADAIWEIVTEKDAWRGKLLDGFRRFSIPYGKLPRALSEDNLCKDRGVARRWFILGGGQSDRPRYNVKLCSMSATFGLKRETLGPEYQKNGGVVIWPTRSGGMPGGLGEPYIKWVNKNDEGVLVFVSPDVREKLH